MRGQSPHECRLKPRAGRTFRRAGASSTNSRGPGPLSRQGRAGRFLGISVRSLDRAAAAGLLPRPDLTIGRSPRWAPETIQKLLKSPAEVAGERRKPWPVNGLPCSPSRL